MSEVFYIHTISDSTGETLNSLMRSIMTQFEGVKYDHYNWPLIRTKGQMQRVLDVVKEKKGIVLYTIVEEALEKQLRAECRELNIRPISVLGRFIKEFSNFFSVEPKEIVGRQHRLDEDYFARVDAIDFTLTHDDGQGEEDIEEADIIIIGVSRTSKTPTCVYLANKGYKVANIPFVDEKLIPEKIPHLKNILIVGLIIVPERLIQIRKSRLSSLNEQRETDYVKIEQVQDEVKKAKNYFLKHKWPIIDVTKKSVEETSANILQIYDDFKRKR
ncbi:MAG: pyruvate, water dikinase regulatory protein [Alphaproteobacteria bacterium]|jgi:regulator of PEP synthase PpsR (kinase-PPPase family)